MIKHLVGRSNEELEERERSLLSGKSIREMSYDDLMDLRSLIGVEIMARRTKAFNDQKMQFRKDVRVTFSARDGVHTGYVRRKGKKRATVIETSPKPSGEIFLRQWRVPYEHLTLA